MRFYQKFYSWRTSALGGGAIAMAVADLVAQLTHGGIDPNRIGADVTGFITGLGLLFARDSAASDLEHMAEHRAIDDQEHH